jgi:hypothetical protein
MIPLYSELAEAGHSLQVRSKSASTGRAGTHFFVPFSRTDLLRRGFASCFVNRASNAASDGFILGTHLWYVIAYGIAVQLRTSVRHQYWWKHEPSAWFYSERIQRSSRHSVRQPSRGSPCNILPRTAHDGGKPRGTYAASAISRTEQCILATLISAEETRKCQTKSGSKRLRTAEK